MQQQRAAIYARYSTDHQRDTSLEDQVRNCRRLAEEAGYIVPPELIFADAAITGTASGLQKRTEYQSLLKAWDEGKFEALIVDEISRLARTLAEIGRLEERIERTGVRLIAVDGLDSGRAQWQLMLGITGTLAAHSVRETRHRVIRGMQGQLERGFDIACAAFGYDNIRVLDANGTPVGTRWVVNEAEAAVVREIYAWRVKGKSLAAIAAALNARGIAPPRKGRTGAGYWRPGTVYQLLGNRIYTGIFVWNGSAFARAKARKERRTLNEVEYARPQLRLVDDGTWNQCNEHEPRLRGGRKQLLAGLLSCSDCGCTLTVVPGRGAAQAYCATCQSAHCVGARERWFGYVSIRAPLHAMRYVLARLLTGAALQEFRSRLRQRLEGDRTAEITSLEARVTQLTRACERLARVLRDVDRDDDVLSREYRKARTEMVEAQGDLRKARQVVNKATRAAIERQLTVDPARVLERLLADPPDVAAAQAALGRLFPRIVLAARPRRFESTWDVALAPGVGVAEAAETEVVDRTPVTMRIRVTCGAKRPTEWRVEEV